MIEGLPVFLSAGVPYDDPERNPDFVNYPCNAFAVREAVRAVVSTVVVDRPLVFGGQPAVTRFVWDAAQSLNASEAVFIYQSEWFRDSIPEEARFFKNLIWTEVPNNAPQLRSERIKAALVRMRETMICDRTVNQVGEQLPPFCAAIFIGGMDGVEKEWEMFRKLYPETPAIPIASTAGAAGRLIEAFASDSHRQMKWNSEPPQYQELMRNLRYKSVIRSLLSKCL